MSGQTPPALSEPRFREQWRADVRFSTATAIGLEVDSREEAEAEASRYIANVNARRANGREGLSERPDAATVEVKRRIITEWADA